MSFHRITLTVNGSLQMVDVPGHLTLLQMLRERLALTGTKNGCSAGECGACTVLWNGEPGDGTGGTASAVAEWRARGYPVEVIDLKGLVQAGNGGVARSSAPEPRPASPDQLDTRIMGVLFADVVNFSKLGDFFLVP